jgi:hypothetical protein
MPRSTESLNARDTAAHLASELGGKPERWLTWLANDRRPGRSNELPPLPGPGRPHYLSAAIDAFIEADRARRLKDTGPSGRVAEVLRAVGIGEERGSSTGRRLDCQVAGQLDETTGIGFVQLVIATPLLVYRLDVSQAREIALQLTREADDAEKMQAIQCGEAKQ